MSRLARVPLGHGYEPGSAKWRGTVSASKIAAIAEIGDWPDREGEMRRMLGLDPPRRATPRMLAGQLLEPVVRDLYQREHPEQLVLECGGFAIADEPRFTATPDGLVLEDCRAHALLEIKFVTSVLAWDKRGVPAHYQAQAQWQMHVTGVDQTVFAVTDHVRLDKLEHHTWRVGRDEAMIAHLAERARAFLAEHDERAAALAA